MKVLTTMAFGKSLDRKTFSIFVIVVACCMGYSVFKEICNDTFKSLITLPNFNLGLTIIFFSLTAVHKYKFNNYNFKKIEFSEVKQLVTDLISTFMDPATLVCSISILRGLFLQKVYSINHFSNFSDTELVFIFVAGIYFGIKSGMEIWNMSIECFKITTPIENTSTKST